MEEYPPRGSAVHLRDDDFMELDLFAGMAVTDYERALAWYERLLGKPATFEAHATESVWELAEHRYVNVVVNAVHAGHCQVTVFLEEYDGFLDEARGRGVEPETTETYENGVRKAIFRDPDGNEFGFGGAPVES
jgi:catechol 2,3-dioxygenase-like lactoylglutathione lyase family enzyme